MPSPPGCCPRDAGAVRLSAGKRCGSKEVPASSGMESMRQLRASRVDPRGEPVRTDISGGTGKLADQNNRGLVVKAIVVFVSIGFFSMAGVAIGQKDHFQRTVRGEARFKSKIRRVADEGGISGPHGKERGITVNKGGAEA